MTTNPLPPPVLRHDPSVPPAHLAGSLQSLDDDDLLSFTAGGDVEAFSVLYSRHASLLLAMAGRVLGNREDAEEALQDSFLHAWKKAGDYQRSRSSVLTWLVLITRSRSLDRLRSQQSVSRLKAEYSREGGTAATPPQLVSRVLDRERSDRVMTAMRELPAAQRRVVELCYYGGLSQQEIAKHTSTPLGTVKTRHLLAMKKLRAALADQIRQLI
ncbi:MAG: sigma-70 family RNA polymerase sigma factor [bacterium]|nr:sigma-70 family RNA polymerase sigma factor [bacterium]